MASMVASRVAPAYTFPPQQRQPVTTRQWDGRRMMGEERAPYTVGASTTAQPQQTDEPQQQETERAIGWYARVPATVIRDRRLSAGLRDVLIDLLLYANAQGECHPSQTTIGNDLGISREEVNRRIRQLKQIGYLTTDVPTAKGGSSTYHLHLNPPIPTCDETVTPYTQPVMKRSQGCDQMVTGGVIKRSHRTDPSNRSNDQTQEIDANASSGAPALAASAPTGDATTVAQATSQTQSQKRAPKPDRPARTPTAAIADKPARELSPDHQYRVDLLKALEVARGAREGNHGADWKLAGQFYALPAGTPAIEQVVAWFSVEIQRPRWDSHLPDLHELGLNQFILYQRAPANYQAAITRARKAADGTLVKQRAVNAPIPAESGRTFSRTNPDIWK